MLRREIACPAYRQKIGLIDLHSADVVLGRFSKSSSAKPATGSVKKRQLYARYMPFPGIDLELLR